MLDLSNDRDFTFFDAWATGDMSGAIERSEKRGQQQMVTSQRLPINLNNYGRKTSAREQYEAMEIEIIDEYDDLFYNVKLPDGWEIKPTDHSMWNNLYDNKGRLRANYFYKAAFYDRDAFVNFSRRYNFEILPFD